MKTGQGPHSQTPVLFANSHNLKEADYFVQEIFFLNIKVYIHEIHVWHVPGEDYSKVRLQVS